MRILLAAIVALLCTALLGPGGASASTRIQYGVQDDAWLLYGPPASPAQRARGAPAHLLAPRPPLQRDRDCQAGAGTYLTDEVFLYRVVKCRRTTRSVGRVL